MFCMWTTEYQDFWFRSLRWSFPGTNTKSNRLFTQHGTWCGTGNSLDWQNTKQIVLVPVSIPVSGQCEHFGIIYWDPFIPFPIPVPLLVPVPYSVNIPVKYCSHNRNTSFIAFFIQCGVFYELCWLAIKLVRISVLFGNDQFTILMMEIFRDTYENT